MDHVDTPSHLLVGLAGCQWTLHSTSEPDQPFVLTGRGGGFCKNWEALQFFCKNLWGNSPAVTEAPENWRERLRAVLSYNQRPTASFSIGLSVPKGTRGLGGFCVVTSVPLVLVISFSQNILCLCACLCEFERERESAQPRGKSP